MTRPALLLLPLVFLACKNDEPPDATQAAVRVDVSFNFQAGCIVVVAEDARDASKTGRAEVPITDAAKRQVTVAVFRQDDWSRTLKLTASAHEKSCSGAKVDTDDRSATLETAGTQTVSIQLEAVDSDNDGYVPTAGGGTDCDDTNATVSQRSFFRDGDGDGFGEGAAAPGCIAPTAQHVERGGDCDDTRASVRPGLTEACDGLDNDCQNGPDDGLAQTAYFRDGDGDGRGAGTAVTACAAPPEHVAQGGDCDDGDSQRRPGFNEVCDGKDNDCAGGVDNGLPVGTYYRDADTDTYGTQAGSVQDCRVPDGYVNRSGDCDDGDAQRRPGLAEVCDGKDNNCQNGVDDGLAVSTYYRDGDGDTYGIQSDTQQDCRAPSGYVNRAGDCDDSTTAVNPGVEEACNNTDDNCNGGTDEGFDKQWYRDFDGDTYGNQGDRVEACVQPNGYVRATPTFDCNDGNSEIRPGRSELCNDIDDNCANGTDEGFLTGPQAKGASCSTPCPGGRYICNPTGSATTCDAPQPRNYYPDVDGDGAGDEAATAQSLCSGTPGLVENQQDCDDRDRHNSRNRAEVCDDRDNNCVNGADEGNICGGTDWVQLADSAVTGTRGWNTVALNQGSTEGYPVWIAGSNGVLARKANAMSAFTSLDGRCGTNHWNAAWVRPSDGRVYLAGSGGRVAEYTGTGSCTSYTVNGGNEAYGIVGFETGTPPLTTVVLYVVDGNGRLHVWRPQEPAPGNAPVEADNNAAVYLDIHGFSASRVFLTGRDSGPNPLPRLETYTGAGQTSPQNIVSDTQNTTVRGVWMGASNFAYAVGDSSIAEQWNGTAWSAMASPPTANFTSVCAPDPSSGYITDTAGNIRRYTGSAWVLHHTAGGPLEDIALVSPTNVWAVGPNGRVIHFPAAP
jgi:hypothetical protein